MKLWKSMSVYTISNLSQKAIGFALLPLITMYLSTSETGDLSTIMAIVALIGPLIMMSAHGAINLEFFRQDQGKDNFSAYLSSALMNPLILFLATALLVFLFGGFLADWLEMEVMWIYLIPVLALTTLIPQVLSVVYQAREQPFNHAAYNISMTLLDLGLSILLLVGLSMSWEGRILGNFGTKFLFSLVGLFLLWRSGLLKFNVQKVFMKDALWFGLPLVPHILSANIMDLSDRLFIREMINVDELGIYDIGYKIGSIILILQAAINMAWLPFFFKKMKAITEQSKREIVRLSYLMLGGLAFTALMLHLVSPLIFRYFVWSADYQSGLKYVGIIALAYVFLGAYKVFAGYIIYTKNNKYLSYIAVFNIIFNLFLNYTLIGKYGAIGAAYATLASYFMFFILTAIISQRIYPMPWFGKFWIK